MIRMKVTKTQDFKVADNVYQIDQKGRERKISQRPIFWKKGFVSWIRRVLRLDSLIYLNISIRKHYLDIEFALLQHGFKWRIGIDNVIDWEKTRSNKKTA